MKDGKEKGNRHIPPSVFTDSTMKGQENYIMKFELFILGVYKVADKDVLEKLYEWKAEAIEQGAFPDMYISDKIKEMIRSTIK